MFSAEFTDEVPSFDVILILILLPSRPSAA